MSKGSAICIGVLLGVVGLLLVIITVQFSQQPRGTPNVVCPHTLPLTQHHVHMGLTARPLGTQVMGARIFGTRTHWVVELLHSLRAAHVNLDSWSVIDHGKEGHQVVAVSQDEAAFLQVLKLFMESKPDLEVEFMPGLTLNSTPQPGGLLAASRRLTRCLPNLPLRALLPSERGETIVLFHAAAHAEMAHISQHVRACMERNSPAKEV